jgi:hypothetical protein
MYEGVRFELFVGGIYTGLESLSSFYHNIENVGYLLLPLPGCSTTCWYGGDMCQAKTPLHAGKENRKRQKAKMMRYQCFKRRLC